MKKFNLLKLLFSAMVFFAGATLSSCVDDNSDEGMPSLTVTPDTLDFNADGTPEGASSVVVDSNRPWTLAFISGSDWVTPSATSGVAGKTTLEFVVPASSAGRTAKLEIQLSNNYGVYMAVPITINQGEIVPEQIVYNETCGTNGGSTSPYPSVAQYSADGNWVTTGDGSTNVTYTASTGVDMRNSLSSAKGTLSNYDGSGGTNIFFGNGSTYFTVQSIKLPDNIKTYTLTFGASYYGGPSTDVFSALTVQFSKDGATWTDAIPYVFNDFKANINWNLATLDFTLKDYSSTLYVKFLSTKPAESNYRIDDISLVTSNGGQVVDLGGGSATWTVTPDAIALNSTSGSTGTISITTDTAWTASTTGSGFTISPNSGTGSGQITVTATGANTTPDTKTLGTVVLTGAGSSTVNISQKGVVNNLFLETYGDLAEALNPYPLIPSTEADAYLIKGGYGWVTGTTEYLGNKASLRWAINPSTAAATAGMSGLGHMWLAVPTASNSSTSFFTVNNLKTTTETGIDFSFGVLAGTSTAVTTTTNFCKVAVSINGGTTWTDVTYTLSEALNGTSWKLATGSYSFPQATSTVSFRISYELNAANTDGLRIEDVTLTPRSGAPLPSVQVDPTSIAFTSASADNVGKTIQVTTANDTGLTLFAKSSDATNFPVSLANKVVTVKATANTGNQRGATVSVYLATSETATPAASVSVPVTQVAGGGATYDNISDVIAGGAGNNVEIKGTVVGTHAQGLVVKDNTGLLYVYLGTDGTTSVVGDEVTVSGTTQLYGNLIQLGVGSVVTRLNTGTYTQPTPTAFDGAAVTAYANGTAPLPVQYIRYSGTLTISGNYYNVAVVGTTVQGSISYPATGLVDPSLNGQPVVVTGYAIGTPNANRNYLNTMAISVTGTSSSPNISGVNPTSLSWTATETAAKTLAVTGTNLTAVTYSGQGAHYTVQVGTVTSTGCTVTVTPTGANSGSTAISSTLSLTATGGNTVTVSLSHLGTGGGTDTKGTYTSMAQFIPSADSSTDCYYGTGASTVNGQTSSGVKLGTGSKAGVFTSAALGVTGSKKLSFYGMAWNGKTATLYVKVNNGGSVAPGSQALATNTGAAGNPPYTITVTDSDYYTLNLTGLTATSTVTISTAPDFTAAADANSGRAVVMGIQVY